jgi:hypothetical protein
MELYGRIQHASDGLNTTRQGEMIASMDMLDRHGPPLAAFSGQYSGEFGDLGTRYYPLALADDHGAFIYLPLVGYLLRTSDLDALLKWFFVVFFVPLLVLYPLLLYELTRSFIASLAAPAILLGHSAFLSTSGIWWLSAWANLLLLPSLLLVAERWKQSRLWILVGLALVASFASSIRANAGLGFVIGALLLVCLRMPRWRLRLLSAVLLIIAYFSIGTFAMRAVQVQRDDVIGQDFTSAYPNGHLFWHAAYVGLGYLKNPYGIRPTDRAAAEAAKRQDPGAVYPTKRYEAAVRKVYLHILRRHPGFVLHGYAVKAGIVLWRAADWFPLAIFTVPLALLFGKRRRARLFQCSLLLGAGVLGALEGVIVTPTPSAQVFGGWYSFLLLLWLLSLGWLLRPLEATAWRLAIRLRDRWVMGAAYPKPPWLSWWGLSTRLMRQLTKMRRSLAAAISATTPRQLSRAALASAAVIVVFAAQNSARSADAASAYWDLEAPLVPRASIHGKVIARWQLRKVVPAGIVVLTHSVTPSADGLHVRTTRTKYGYQLVPPAQSLQPGRYHFLVDGRVLAGGLQLAAVDNGMGTTIVKTFYSADGAYSREKRMAVSFDLATPTEVEFPIANFSLLSHSSDWTLRSFVLVRESWGCALPTPDAWFTRPAPRSTP